MQTLLDHHWHHLPTEEVLELLESDPENGLDTFEVRHRHERFGPNVVTTQRGPGALKRLLLQFHQPLIYILLAAGIITVALGEWIDASVIFAVVLINALVGFLQETKAVKALEALARTISTEATVLRTGSQHRIAASELVPGDVVVLQAGDKVPADMRLIRVRELQVNESALTGESLPIEKRTECLAPDTILADRRNMTYASTLITYGRSLGVVTAIGDNTEVGRISRLIAKATELQTPLTRKIAHFSHILLFVILSLAALTFLVGLWRGESAFNMFMAAVALAVGAIPEGLPAAVTIVLAIGVARMARRQAIIRKLPAVETLGSTTVICSDKTGTLTENQMTVQEIVAGRVSYRVTGVGYTPEGAILRQDTPVDPFSSPALLECLKAGLLCNDSRLVATAGGWEVQGDPTEGALIVSAHKIGLTAEVWTQQLARLDTIPFESQHQYMATLHDTGDDEADIVYLKGAVEAVLERCGNMFDDAGQVIALDVASIHKDVESMATKGLRVLAFARCSLPPGTISLMSAAISSDLTFLGLQGMIDPPRPEAVAAVHTCQRAGIQVKMITGDHALTAAAIAQQIGIDGTADPNISTTRVLTGQTMATYDDITLIDVAESTAVFARVTPEQKLRLVEALQARSHVVAMTGDGVNDAPALKQANIGVAMGIAGTEVAKEAADMVLTDDNFASIEAAVEEGRGVFDNLTKFIVWTLPTNVGEGLVILAAIFAGVALPILPVQILWINMTTAILLGLMLAFEPKEAGIMQRRPRDPHTPILTHDLLGRIGLVGMLLLASAFGLFEWELYAGASVAEARTVAVGVFVLVELFYLLNCRSLTHSMFQIGLFSNLWVWAGITTMLILQGLFTYLPVMNSMFHSAPIGLASWSRILAVSLLAYGVVEVEKWLRRRLKR